MQKHTFQSVTRPTKRSSHVCRSIQVRATIIKYDTASNPFVWKILSFERVQIFQNVGRRHKSTVVGTHGHYYLTWCRQLLVTTISHHIHSYRQFCFHRQFDTDSQLFVKYLPQAVTYFSRGRLGKA